MQNIFSTIRVWYGRCAFVLSYLQSPLLLAIRLYWGYQFIEDGLGKLNHLAKVTEFFASLGLPAPGATASWSGRSSWWAVSCSHWGCVAACLAGAVR